MLMSASKPGISKSSVEKGKKKNVKEEGGGERGRERPGASVCLTWRGKQDSNGAA